MFDVAAAMFAVLLVLTGLAKVRQPEPTSRAIAELGFPFRPILGRVLGIVEVGIGMAALATGGAVAWSLQAGVYLAFAAWVGVALWSGTPIASCGCLGTPDTPPYWGHLAVDVVAVTVSTGAAATATGSPFAGDPLEAVAMLTVAAVGAMLAWAVIGDAARASGMVRS